MSVSTQQLILQWQDPARTILGVSGKELLINALGKPIDFYLPDAHDTYLLIYRGESIAVIRRKEDKSFFIESLLDPHGDDWLIPYHESAGNPKNTDAFICPFALAASRNNFTVATVYSQTEWREYNKNPWHSTETEYCLYFREKMAQEYPVFPHPELLGTPYEWVWDTSKGSLTVREDSGLFFWKLDVPGLIESASYQDLHQLFADEGFRRALDTIASTVFVGSFDS